MSKIYAGFIASAAFLSAQPSIAQILTPPGTWEFEGTAMVDKVPAPPFPCSVTITLTVPNDAPDPHGTYPHGDGINTADLDAAPGDPLCNTLVISSNPHAAEVATILGATVVTIKDVRITSITAGGCSGDIPMTFEHSTNILQVASILPADPAGSGDCSIFGSASLVSPGDVDIDF